MSDAWFVISAVISAVILGTQLQLWLIFTY